MSAKLKSLSGPSAGAVKYDLLTMLSLVGLHGSATLQASMLRLISVVTARYNWRNDELSIGQRDMARLWAVNERTVKREMKRLTEANILICTRQGVRGRVGAYRLNQPEIARLSQPVWSEVGPDFAYRMEERYRLNEPKVVAIRPDIPKSDGDWGRVQSLLEKANPSVYTAWFSDLRFEGQAGGTIVLRATNQFKQRYIETQLWDQLLAAVVPVFPDSNVIILS